jgi:dipeptidyl-peptidase-3
MILCYGQNIVSRILTPIHIWKCTGDSEPAKAFVENYSSVPDHFLKIRKIIIDSNIPRRLELYFNFELDEEKNVTIKSYPETQEGIINSFVDR